MDEAYPTEAVEAPDDRPLVERIIDKNWKKRLNAYEDVKKLFGGDDSTVFSSYVEYFPKMLVDTNAACMDMAFDSAILFADKAPDGFIGRYSEAWFAPIVDKSFGVKPSLLLKGQELCLKIMEADNPTTVTNYLLSRLGDKKPKVSPASLEVIRSGIVSFGAKAFPVKEILAALGPVFNGVNAEGRDQAMSLLVELHKWVGKATLKILEVLRPAQKETFEQLILEQVGQKAPMPTLWLRSERPDENSLKAMEEKAASGSTVAGSGSDMDGRDYVDEVDLQKKLKGSEFSSLIAAEKWDENMRGMQLVIDAIGLTPKIKKGCEVNDVIAACKNFLRAGHINVQTSAVKILALLADGMRSDFAGTARQMNETVILKYKEKKLIPECHGYLTQVLRHSLELNSMIDCLSENIANKKNPPHARIGLIDFITTVFASQPGKVSVDQLKVLADMLIGVSDDSDPKIRDAVAACLISLASLAKSTSATAAVRVLGALEQNTPRLYAKIKPALNGENILSAVSDDKKAPAVIAKKAAAKPVEEEKMPVATLKPSKKPSISVASKVDDDSVEEILGSSEAEEILGTLDITGWPTSINEKMANAKWQDKVEACDAIGKAIEASCDGGKYASAVARYLLDKTGFKLINVNILKGVIALVTQSAKAVGATPYSRGAAWTFIKSILDKLSDKKACEPILEMLMALTEATSPGFVFKRCKMVLDEAKSPVVHENFLVWLKSAITTFGASRFPISIVGALCQEELENKVVTVRTSAVEVLGALYNQLGPRVQSVAISESMKPALKQLIEAEFAKVGYDASKAATVSRVIKGETGGDPGGEGGGLSRVDLGKELGGNTFLNEINMTEGKTSWQNRKSAMESLISACDRSGHFVESNKFVADVFKSLKDRMEDAQANNRPIAANAITHLVTSLEVEPAAKLVKLNVAFVLIGGFADGKKSMRDAVVSALDALVTMNKGGKTADPVLMSPFIPAITEMLKNPVGRLELLSFIMNHSYALKTDAVAEWMVNLVVCLQDKTAAVRTLAEALLFEISSRALVTKPQLDRGFKDLSASTMRALQASHSKITTAYGTSRDGTPAVVQEFNEPPPAPTVEIVSASIAPVVTDEEEPVNLKPVSRIPLMKKVDSATTLDKVEDSAAPPGEKFFLKRIMKSVQLKRLEDFPKLHLPLEPGEADFQVLHELWDPFLSDELSVVLFPVLPPAKKPLINMDVLVSGILGLLAQIDSPLFMQHTDLVLRWCSYGLALKETSVTLLKLLQLIIGVFDKIRAETSQMHDSEIASIIPHLILSSGHTSERHRAAFKQAITAASEVIAPQKLCQQLLTGLSCKNRRSRIVCLEELQRTVEGAGTGALGRTGARDIGVFLDDKDIDTASRSACLELLHTIYVSLGQDMPKFVTLLGKGASAQTLSLIEQRTKQKGGRNSIGSKFSTPPGDRYNSNEAPFQLNLSTTPSKSRSVEEYDYNSETSLDIVLGDVNGYSDELNVLNDEDLDGIFVDIVRKIDTLTGFDTCLHKDKSVLMYVKYHEDAKDYIRMLLSNVKGTWHKNEDTVREDIEQVAKQSNPLMRRICLCVNHAFSPQSMLDPSGANNEIDTTLASAALSTLYAFIDKSAYVQRFTVHTMTDVIAVCARALVDERLYAQHPNPTVNDAHKLICRGINLILLKFTETANTGLLFCALLRTFTLCIPEMDRSNYSVENGLVGILSAESTKVVVRLFVQLLNMELKSSNPFSMPSVSVPRLMYALNDFFSRHPHSFQDDTPFRAAKSLVAQAVSALGADAILKAMRSHNISQDNVLSKMVARLGGVELLPAPRIPSINLAQPSTVNDAQSNELGLIIDEITNAKDKDTSIRKLYTFLRGHPEVDVHAYFQRVSLTFRRFVLDNLARIEADSIADEIVAARDKKPLVQRFYDLIQSNPHLDGNQILLSVPPELRRFILDQLADIETAALQNQGPQQAHNNAPSTQSTPSSESVALRILEGLKKRENPGSKVSDITKKRSSLTPRLDKVKGSLDDLSSALNLSPALDVRKTSDLPDEDADLASRLSKLRSLGNK